MLWKFILVLLKKKITSNFDKNVCWVLHTAFLLEGYDFFGYNEIDFYI